MIPEKQIKEMAKIIRNANGKGYPDNYFIADAKVLYRAGYRKSTELSEEIFAEIDGLLDKHISKANYTDGTCTLVFKRTLEVDLADLKKKYIGKDTNVTTKESEKDDG